jgi:regulator of sirC expression with transglutaminase-like and TPR domain
VTELALADQPAAAALEFARFEYPEIEPDAYLARLDSLAGAVEGGTHLSLRRVLAIREGYGGNVDDFGNPDNSFLNRVLETRRGIPISLSLIWIEVGRRVGIDMEGVGLPGHFLVYAGKQLVDPFHYGEAIGADEAAALVASSLGGAPRLNPAWLEPVTTPELIARMLRNLEARYSELNESDRHPWVGECLAGLS